MLTWYRKMQARRFLRHVTRTRKDTPDVVLVFLASDVVFRMPEERHEEIGAISTAMHVLRTGKKP